MPHIKAVIFDIGGVVLQSPFVAIDEYERENGLPPNYLNVSLASRGSNGAWQRFERGEIDLHVFYSTFSRDLSDIRNGNIWYEEYCIRKGLACPRLPESLDIDGRDLFGRMMQMASSYDAHILAVIRKLRAMGKWRIVALTNNFGASSWQDLSLSERQFLGWQDGPTPKHLRDLFDEFYDSSQVGLRKPDPEFYLHACRESGFRPEEAIFLDDIKMNLKTASQLGMVTIHVPIGGTLEVIKRLEEKLGVVLSSGQVTEGTAKL